MLRPSPNHGTLWLDNVVVDDEDDDDDDDDYDDDDDDICSHPEYACCIDISDVTTCQHF